jgi:serpin B
MTRLVLTNAIYFKGTWKEQFEESLTRQQPFTLVNGTKIQAPLMSRKATYRYLDQKEFQALEMTYEGEELSMLVLLPQEPDGIYEMEKQLAPQQLQGWIGAMRPAEVIVSFPKFEITSKFSLSETFQKLGLTEAFTPQADFSGMLDVKKDLYFDAVVHKAYVKVNEEGTEAAAATGVVMRTTQAMQRPLVFRADHPFLFMIREKRSGSILFIGRVMNPTA